MTVVGKSTEGFPRLYAEASQDERDRLEHRLSELIAEEAITKDLAATQEINSLIQASKAGSYIVWLLDVRAGLERMIAAERTLQEHDPAEVEKALANSKADKQSAEDQLAIAIQVNEQAAAALKSAERQRKLCEDSIAQMATGDQLVQSAWANYKDLRDKSAATAKPRVRK